jgi:hypothetical protein
MKSGFLITVVVCAAALSGCGSKDLSKEQAKGQLTDYFGKNPTTQQLLTGMDNIGTVSEAEYFATPGGKYQKALEADGLVTITSKGKVFRPGSTGPKREYFNALDVTLTDKGKKLVTGKPNTVPAISANTWPTVYENAVFCGKEVVDIADVTTTDDSATVEYSWKAANLTPFAVHFHETDPTEKSTCNAALVQNATATLVRKGEVWAVTVAQ